MQPYALRRRVPRSRWVKPVESQFSRLQARLWLGGCGRAYMVMCPNPSGEFLTLLKESRAIGLTVYALSLGRIEMISALLRMR